MAIKKQFGLKPPPGKRVIIEFADEKGKPRKKRKGNPNPVKTEAWYAAQWKKGQSGNPYGTHRKATIISEVYKAKLTDQVDNETRREYGIPLKINVTWAEAIAHGLFKKAVEGDVGAGKEIADRTEGKIPENVSLVGKIDYSAGRTAKEQLMAKLGEEEKK